MTAETLSRLIQNLNFFLKYVAVSIKSIISGSRDCSKKYLDVQKCYVYEAKLIADTITSPISSSLATKDLANKF